MAPLRRLTLAALTMVLVAACASQASRPAQLLTGREPVYPAAAHAQGVTGYVVVAYDIETDGHVSNARVVEADPPGTFDAAALQAVSNWQFKPMLVHGQPSKATDVRSRVAFRLEPSVAADRSAAADEHDAGQN